MKRKINFTTISLVLIPAAVGINYIVKLFAQFLRLPLWLDSIGTILASILAGPIIGAISGGVNNVIYGLTVDPVSFMYAITSIGIGLVAGLMAYKGFMNSFKKAFITGVVVGVIAAIISTPINISLWEGATGNVWGDALLAFLLSKEVPLWLASFLDEIVVDVPDKIAVVLISYGIYKALPINIKSLFRDNDDIKRLD